MSAHDIGCDMDDDCTCNTSEPFFCTYDGAGPHSCRGSSWEHEREETYAESLERLAREAEVRALTRRSIIDRRDDLAEARNLRASLAIVQRCDAERAKYGRVITSD